MSTTVFTDVNAQIAASDTVEAVNDQVFGKKLGIFTRLFGCRHTNVGRPFSQGRSGYRACINCGARRQFDPRTLETFGAFYAPPAAVVRHF
ncbi:MAG TPA: hypothetical protein VFZ49_09140 [Pyrinomonadaceae bacterium]